MYPYYHNNDYYNYGYNNYGYGYGPYGYYGGYYGNPFALMLILKIIKWVVIIFLCFAVYDYHEMGKPVGQESDIAQATVVNGLSSFHRTGHRKQIAYDLKVDGVGHLIRQQVMVFYDEHPNQRLRMYNFSRQCHVLEAGNY